MPLSLENKICILNELIIFLNLLTKQLIEEQNITLILTSCMLIIILWISKILLLHFFQKYHTYFELGILISNLWLYWYFMDTQAFSYIFISLGIQNYFRKLFDLTHFFAFLIICSLLQQFDSNGFKNSIYWMPIIIASHVILFMMVHFKFGIKQTKESIQEVSQQNIIKTLCEKYNWLEIEQASIINSQYQVEYQYQSSPYFQSSHKQYDDLQCFVADCNNETKALKDHLKFMTEQIKNGSEISKFHVFRNQKFNLYIILDDSFDQIYFVIFKRQKDEKNQEVLFQVCQSISHELSTSLNSIIILSNLQMESDSLSKDQKQQIVEPVLLNAQQLQLITNNLKDYPNLLANDIQIYISRFDIVEEILEIIEYFSFSIQSKGLKLKLHFDIADTYIEADKSRIKQIFYQLMSNAVRFTIVGIITISINRDSENLVIISVEDQGIGMSQEETQRLQELLKGPTPLKISQNSVGCGLGLFISNLISKKINQKSLEFQTQYSKGSKFTFYILNQKQTLSRGSSSNNKSSRIMFYNSNTYTDNLFNLSYSLKSPTTKTLGGNVRSSKVSNRIRQSMAQLGNFSFEEDDKSSFLNISDEESLDLNPPNFSTQYRINDNKREDKNECCRKTLIVDDEFFNIFALQKVMQTLGFSSDHAYNGQEALDKIKNKPNCNICNSKDYALIFLDINMPILDGFQTVNQIKRMIKNNQIQQPYCIANSAYGDVKTKQKAFDSGMDYYFTKPIDIQLLKQLINRLFKKK